MKKKIYRILKNPWTVGIFTPIIATAITSVLISSTNKINTKESLKIIFGFFIDILNYKMSIGMIMVIIISLICIFTMFYKKNTESNYVGYPEWYTDFKNLNYKKWWFKWEYEVYDGKTEIENLRAICKCGCDLNRRSICDTKINILFCPSCQNTYDLLENGVKDEVKNKIIHMINKGYYSKIS